MYEKHAKTENISKGTLYVYFSYFDFIIENFNTFFFCKKA